jgi:hypothetical protein
MIYRCMIAGHRRGRLPSRLVVRVDRQRLRSGLGGSEDVSMGERIIHPSSLPPPQKSEITLKEFLVAAAIDLGFSVDRMIVQ